MSNDITPTQKLELANELIKVVNRYCEENHIDEFKAAPVLLLAYAATEYNSSLTLATNQ